MSYAEVKRVAYLLKKLRTAKANCKKAQEYPANPALLEEDNIQDKAEELEEREEDNPKVNMNLDSRVGLNIPSRNFGKHFKSRENNRQSRFTESYANKKIEF